MKLTKGEYCQFNLKSRMSLLSENGICIEKKKVNDELEIKLFSIYDFYVEVHYSYSECRVIKVEPLWNNNWLSYYAKR